ncbi:MAG: gliding motility protein GldC [Saprospiraceae bacterium]|nr:gliding motility protein GldC [Saprospiraceae bacterium]
MEAHRYIQLRVHLDEQQIPDQIEWRADENQESWVKAKAFLLSIFEEQSKDTMKLDLWTSDFQMSEMDRFMYYSLRSLCDTYMRATNNTELANDFRSFIEHFGKQTELIQSS